MVVGTPRTCRRAGINSGQRRLWVWRQRWCLGLPPVPLQPCPWSSPFIYPEQNSSQPQSSWFQIKCHLSLLSYRAAFFPNLPDFLRSPGERCVTLITMSMFKLVTIPREAKGSGEGIFGCV